MGFENNWGMVRSGLELADLQVVGDQLLREHMPS
jgi:hypothetical protein